MNKDYIADQFKVLQNTITQTIENTDGSAKFKEDKWIREEGGGGRSQYSQMDVLLKKVGLISPLFMVLFLKKLKLGSM